MKDMLEQVAGNGLLHRRLFLTQSAALLGAGATLLSARPAHAAPLDVPPWSKTPGAGPSVYSDRSRFEEGVQRVTNALPGTIGTGGSRTPIQHLEGIITPSCLHFERHHNGVPEIDPDAAPAADPWAGRAAADVHHGDAVALSASIRASISSSAPATAAAHSTIRSRRKSPPARSTASYLQRVDGRAARHAARRGRRATASGDWLLAEGADAAAMSRSVPLAKALDDAMIALYQNGERLRPRAGLPGAAVAAGLGRQHEREMAAPAEGYARADAYQGRDVEVLRSAARRPSPAVHVRDGSEVGDHVAVRRLKMQGPGLYEISGLAWSGSGRIRRVEVSADGGARGARRRLPEPVLSKALTRFRLPWDWNGGPQCCKAVPPTRKATCSRRATAWLARYAPRSSAITTIRSRAGTCRPTGASTMSTL